MCTFVLYYCIYTVHVCDLPCRPDQWWCECQQGLCRLPWSPPNPPPPIGWRWSGFSGHHGSQRLAIFGDWADKQRWMNTWRKTQRERETRVTERENGKRKKKYGEEFQQCTDMELFSLVMGNSPVAPDSWSWQWCWYSWILGSNQSNQLPRRQQLGWWPSTAGVRKKM